MTLSRVLASQVFAHQFQHLISHVGSNICPACDEAPETSEHFLCSCVTYSGMWVISQVFSSHSTLHYFQHIIGYVGSNICPACGESAETSEHFLCSCIAYSRLRFRVFGSSPVSFDFVLYYCSVTQVLHFCPLSGRFYRGKFTGRPPSQGWQSIQVLAFLVLCSSPAVGFVMFCQLRWQGSSLALVSCCRFQVGRV